MKLKKTRKHNSISPKTELILKIVIPIAYAIVYMAAFFWLEQRPVKEYHIIRMDLDSRIPFCEYFIIPYMLWFLYIVATVVLFIFLDRKDYIKLCITLGTGMTIFLLVSYFIPNMQPLRPKLEYFTRDNIFLDMVKALYATDTCTNVFPSIHVFNSLAANFAIQKSRQLSSHKVLRAGSHILCISIILSTMFLKQHSLFDVLTGGAMAAAMYWLVYYLPEAKAAAAEEREGELLKGIIH
ncbi:MAG: phosphatase PAP2 family protein [Lachnospiraceae bacterium]